MAAATPLRAPAVPSRSRATGEIPRPAATRPPAAPAARVLGRTDPHPDGILRAARRRGGHRLSGRGARLGGEAVRSEEHTSELQSRSDLVCRLLLGKKNRALYEFTTLR